MMNEPAAELDEELWWHVYGGVTTDSCDWGGGAWALFILGESPVHPEQLAADGKLEIKTATQTFRYLRSYNHDPSDEERRLITPEEYWVDGADDAQ